MTKTSKKTVSGPNKLFNKNTIKTAKVSEKMHHHPWTGRLREEVWIKTMIWSPL
jgi:hypothetical protein